MVGSVCASAGRGGGEGSGDEQRRSWRQPSSSSSASALASSRATRSLLMPALLAVSCCCAPAAAWEYGLMLDAGSGGTRLHFYRWPTRVADPLRPLYAAVTIPEELFHIGISPGVSAFASNITGLKPYMMELLNEAMDRLQSYREVWYLMPIYLKATAGARDLYQDQRDELFAEIRDILSSSMFRFDSHYWARTISGEEEAVNAWLTVNAVKGTYRTDSAMETWGALDMGGASTQMAFIPKDISIIQNYYPLHMSYVIVHLYSHSFLEFGYRDAHQRLIRMLTRRGLGDGSTKHPVPSPCVKKDEMYVLNFSDTFAASQTEYWVKGTQDYDECAALATELLDINARCYVPAKDREFAVDSRKGACGINGIYEPLVDNRKFVAMGQYAKQAMYLGLQMDTLIPLSDWMEATEKTCSSSKWSSRCWRIIWLGTLLHKGLRFPLHTKQIMFSAKLNGQETGWALGAMMHEVNYYPWRSQSSGSGPFSLEASPDEGSLRGAGAGAGAGFALAAVAGATALLAVGAGVGWAAATWRYERHGAGDTCAEQEDGDAYRAFLAA